MKVKIRRIDKSLPLPAYATAGAAGLDCCARKNITIAPKSIGYIPLNICVQPPKNHFVVLAARSSLHKYGLMLANGIGIADEDYCGNNDEYKAAVYNFTDKPILIKKKDRVAQIIFRPYDKIQWKEVKKMGDHNRGGFGTTGKK